jgi:uncharacterized protein YbjQ (UPF0145 family)
MSDEDASVMGEQGDEDASASMRPLQAGELPPEAMRRLTQLGDQGAFSSDLSVADFALCDRLGLRPLSQVMGTSVYQIGYQSPLWGAQAEMNELTTVSEAWNEARRRAFARLRHEASSVGASAVVGVEVSSSVGDWAQSGGYGAVQYLVTGTAVSTPADRAEQNRADGRAAVLTELSVADYAKLLAAGIEPVGIVAWTSVFFVSLLYIRSEQPLMSGIAYQNFEYREVTECFYNARERVTAELGRQAQELGASGIVGVRIRHTTAPQSLNMGPGAQRPGVIASFSAIGTAVRERGETQVQAPRLTMEMTSVE